MSGSGEIFVVPRDQIPQAWPEIAAQVSRVEGEPWGLSDVYGDLLSGHAQAWGVPGGFWITRIESVWTHRYGLVWIAAGNALEAGIEAFRAHCEPWFKSQGCEWIEIVGRRGWERVLPDYRVAGIVLRKPL